MTRRGFLSSAAVGVGVVGVATAAKKLLRQPKEDAASATVPENRDRWPRFEAIGHALRERGCLVQWRHPPNGPNAPRFIVSNSHIKLGGTGVADDRHARILLEEFRLLSSFSDDFGLSRFASEGTTSDTEFPRPSCFEVTNPDGSKSITFQNKSDVRAPGQLVTPNELRERLSDDRQAMELIKTAWNDRLQTEKGTSDIAGNRHREDHSGLQGFSPSDQLFLATHQNDPSFTFRGTENPQTYAQYLAFIDRHIDAGLLARQAEFAMRSRSTDGGPELAFYVNYRTGNFDSVKIGEQEFPYNDLKFAMAVDAGETLEIQNWNAAREAFVANSHEADVVKMGGIHLRNFVNQEKEPARSLGMVITPTTRKLLSLEADGDSHTLPNFMLRYMLEQEQQLRRQYVGGTRIAGN